jgi:hypothetical protein
VFKKINISKLLLWILTPYFSFNTESNLSWVYKYIGCFLQPLQPLFDSYYNDREKLIILAQCKFTKQLQNVLNILYAPDHIYDPTNGGIYFNQVYYEITTANPIYFETPLFAPAITDTAQSTAFAPSITDFINSTTLIIYVPTGLWETVGSQIVADVAMVAPDGIFYEFKTY